MLNEDMYKNRNFSATKMNVMNENILVQDNLIIYKDNKIKKIDFAKYSKMHKDQQQHANMLDGDNNDVSRMRKSNLAKKESDLDDFDCFNLFKDHNFKSYNIMYLKQLLYHVFIEKLIILREMEFLGIPFYGEDLTQNNEFITKEKIKKASKDGFKSKLSHHYEHFQRPGFIEDGKSLDF
jgi:hypothetical protein